MLSSLLPSVTYREQVTTDAIHATVAADQEYNAKSQLSGLAAKWAARDISLLPMDARTIAALTQGAAANSGSQPEERSPSPYRALAVTLEARKPMLCGCSPLPLQSNPPR